MPFFVGSIFYILPHKCYAVVHTARLLNWTLFSLNPNVYGLGDALEQEAAQVFRFLNSELPDYLLGRCHIHAALLQCVIKFLGWHG